MQQQAEEGLRATEVNWWMLNLNSEDFPNLHHLFFVHETQKEIFGKMSRLLFLYNKKKPNLKKHQIIKRRRSIF